MIRHALLSFVFGLAFAVNAQTKTKTEKEWVPVEGSTSTSLGDVLRDKKFEPDVRITDLELRSYAGSLNRYSLQFILGYSGPPVNDLNNFNKPNPDNRPGDNRTNLAGTMGLRYRISQNSAVNLNTGVKWYAPYQQLTGNPAPVPRGRKEYDVADPGLSYDLTAAVGATQIRSQLRAVFVTTDAYRQAGECATLGFSQYVKWTPEILSRLVLGAQLALDYYAYDRGFTPTDGRVSRYYLNVIPSFEYKLGDALNFNTSLGVPFQNLRMSDNVFRIDHQMSTWRVGLGWAITRDIYLNPYLNFFLEEPAIETASLNLNTTFSIF